jgi:hypothetical protein
MSTVTTTNGVLERLGVRAVNAGASAGTWLDTRGAELVSTNPATGEPIASVRQATAADYDTVIGAATRAFETWRLRPAPARGEVVRELANALREHKEDIPQLVEAFLAQLGTRHGRSARLNREAMDAVRRYDWPGNVRELRHAIERALVLSREDEIVAADLPEEARNNAGPAGAQRGGGGNSFLKEADFREAKRKFEIAYLKGKLEEHRWNVSQTAAEIGLHRQSLQEKLRELGIQRPGK